MGFFVVGYMCREHENELEQSIRRHIVMDSMEVLRTNDRGGYTVPAEGLYPFQVQISFLLTSLSQNPKFLHCSNQVLFILKFENFRVFDLSLNQKKNPAFFKNLKAAIENFSFFQCFDPHECLKPVFLDSLLSDKSKSEQTHLLFICNPRLQNKFFCWVPRVYNFCQMITSQSQVLEILDFSLIGFLDSVGYKILMDSLFVCLDCSKW